MTVRSARLASGNSDPAGSGHTAYTCPAGKTALLKDVRVWASTGAPTRAALQVNSGTATVGLLDGPLSAAGLKSVTGFIVLEPGDRILIYAEGGTFSYWCSGAELEGIAP